MNKKIIAIVGKTSSGKDTITNYISKKYNIDILCSYTTRPKRESEKDGVEHYFINTTKMHDILEKERILAYVKFQKTDYEYCTVFSQLKNDVTLYIIDPNGIENFKRLGYDDIDLISIYVHLNEDEIKNRALLRGDREEDIEKRLNSERGMFDEFLIKQKYDYILNSNQNKSSVFEDVDYIMSKIM